MINTILIILGGMLALCIYLLCKLIKNLGTVKQNLDSVESRCWDGYVYNTREDKSHEILAYIHATREELIHLIKMNMFAQFQTERETFQALIAYPHKPELLENEMIQELEDGTYKHMGVPVTYFLLPEERAKSLEILKSIKEVSEGSRS